MFNSKNKVLIALIFIYAIVLSGCSDDNLNNSSADPQENNFTYPFEINSFWYYGTRNFVNNFRPDSLRNIFGSDTIKGYGDAKFIRDTVLNNDTFRVLRNSHSGEGHSHTTYELFKQSDSLLIRYYYASNGSNFGPYRQVTGINYSFNGRKYNSVNEIFSEYNYDNYNSADYNSNGDTNLIIDFPPKRILKYPVSPGYEWVVYYGDTGDKVSKKYLNFENINFLGKEYHCIKIQKLWYSNIFGSPDSNLIQFDYFSKDGMVKRDFLIKDIAVSNELGQVIGYIDAKEESFLNFYLQP